MAKRGEFDNAERGKLDAAKVRGGMRLEVELKFRVGETAAPGEANLLAGAVFSAPVRQVDHYFNHPARDFAVTDEAFRIRQVGELNFVTYKGPKIDATTKTRQEVELELPAGEHVCEQYRQLFELLGFRYVATVAKLRSTANVMYEGLPVEVALDYVEGLGHFCELETVVDEVELNPAQEAIQTLAKQLGLSDFERRSYLELLLVACGGT